MIIYVSMIRIIFYHILLYFTCNIILTFASFMATIFGPDPVFARLLPLMRSCTVGSPGQHSDRTALKSTCCRTNGGEPIKLGFKKSDLTSNK
jgi:hypothetical protein